MWTLPMSWCAAIVAQLKPYKAKYNDQALRVRDTVTFSYKLAVRL